MAISHRATESLAPAPASQWIPKLSRGAGLLVGFAAMAIVATISVRLGARGLSGSDVWNALVAYDPANYEQSIVRTMRLPRTVIALGVGGALAVSGAAMQGVTRNPLADPSIMGVSSGAGFAIVAATYYGKLTSAWEYMPFAFAGGLAAALIVMIIGSAGNGGASPVKLALAGIVISALITSWTTVLLLRDPKTYAAARQWFAGSVVNRDIDLFWQLAPILLGGSLLCLFLGHHLNILSMGDEMAQSLGMRTGTTRIGVTLLVVLMTCAAVAITGPIAYVGLAVPPMVRSIVGSDYRWVLPYSLVIGAVFLTGADILGRIALRPGEVGVGIVTAIIGAPFLVFLARRRNIAG